MIVQTDSETITLGTTETTPTISIVDYSRTVTDDFGVTTVVQRGFSRRLSVRLALPFDQVDTVQRELAALRASTALWIADDRFDWLAAEGFYKDFEVDLAVPPVSYCTLTVEGIAETETVTDNGEDPAPAGSTSTFRLLKPMLVDSAALASSNVPESDHPQWAAGTTYAAGARVILTSTHRIYESLVAGNQGNDPATAADKWLDVGPTKRWAMFDQALGTKTTRATSIAVTLNVTAADAVALLDVVASTVRVQATGYDETQAASSGAVTFLDLPPTTGQVTITASGTGTVSIGTLLAGKLLDLGMTEASPSAGITDYSRKEVDDFGEVTIVQRAWAKRMAAKALIASEAVDVVANRVAAVRATPALWIGEAGLDSLTIYGFFKDFSIEVGETVSKLSLSIEGLSEASPIGPGGVSWSDVRDDNPERPIPEDGATVGAPPGTPVGDRPAEDVVSAIDVADAQLAAHDGQIAAAETDIATAQGQITDLIATYGNTASSAENLQLSELVLAATEAARDEAITAQGSAEASAQASAGYAQTVSDLTDDAAGFAGAAQVSFLSAQSAMAAAYPTRMEHGAFVIHFPQTYAAPDLIAASRFASGAFSTPTGGNERYALALRQPHDVVAGRTIRLKARLRKTDPAYTAYHTYAANVFAADGSVLAYSMVLTTAAATGNSLGEFAREIAFDTILASYPTAAFVRFSLFINRTSDGAGTQPGGNTEVTSFYPVDATSEKAAEASANYVDSAAVLVSQDASAVAADRVLTAQYRQDALDTLGDVNAAAAIVEDQVVVATNAASSAQQSAGLSASVGTGALNPNAAFDDFPSGAVGALPAQWSGDSAGTAAGYRVPDPNGGYAYRLPGAAGSGAYAAFRNTSSEFVRQGGYYVLEADIVLKAGTLDGAGMQLRTHNNSTTPIDLITVPFKTTPDASGAVPGLGVVGRVYQFRKLVQVTGANAKGISLYILSHSATAGSMAVANDIEWRKCLIRPATPAEIRDQTVLTPMEATVATNSLAIATIDTAVASLQTTVQANSAVITTQAQALDDLDTSFASLSNTVSAQGVTVTENTTAISQVEDDVASVAGQWGIEIDVNGRVVGAVKLDGTEDFGSFRVLANLFAVETAGGGPGLQWLDGILWNKGPSTSVLIGEGFGASSDLMFWAGNTPASPAAATKSNGVFWIDADGDAYFGGTLSAGVLKNGAEATGIGTSITSDSGEFGSNGGTITVVVSWTYRVSSSTSYPATLAGRNDFDAAAASYNATTSNGINYTGSKAETMSSSTVALKRGVNGATPTQVQSASQSNGTGSFVGIRPIVGADPGSATITRTFSLSFTYTDPQTSTANRQYIAQLTRGSTLTGTATQRLSVLATEG